MILLLQYTIIFASVLMLVALGGCFSERSGVINIGLEGTMVIGALGGALVMKYLPVSTGAFAMVALTVVASALLGMLFSLFLAVAAISFSFRSWGSMSVSRLPNWIMVSSGAVRRLV